MHHHLPWVLVALGAGCAPRVTFAPGQAERIRHECDERIASGRELTPRHRDIGKLPLGAGTRDRVVVYGASWCDACHFAVDYLERFHIPFVELDVEADPDAREKMQGALAGSGLRGRRALPVIETRGTVMLGFMPCALEAAWRG